MTASHDYQVWEDDGRLYLRVSIDRFETATEETWRRVSRRRMQRELNDRNPAVTLDYEEVQREADWATGLPTAITYRMLLPSGGGGHGAAVEAA